MNTFLKVNLVVVYLLAPVGVFVELPYGASPILGKITLIVLAAHFIELVFMFKRVKLYRGPLATSVVLTLLFGLLHWSRLRPEVIEAPAEK